MGEFNKKLCVWTNGSPLDGVSKAILKTTFVAEDC